MFRWNSDQPFFRASMLACTPGRFGSSTLEGRQGCFIIA